MVQTDNLRKFSDLDVEAEAVPTSPNIQATYSQDMSHAHGIHNHYPGITELSV